MQVVETFFDGLATLSQSTIAEQKAESAVSQIGLLRCRNSGGDEDSTGTVGRVAPLRTPRVDSELDGALRFGVAKGLLFAVGPSPVAKGEQSCDNS